MTGNRPAAVDVSSEAFLSIWRSRLRYQPERGSVRTWVLGIVHNRAIDGLRHADDVSDPHLIWLSMDPEWDPLRNESSFQRLVERCGFAPSPAER